MRLPRDTGQKENLAAFTAWMLLAIVYYCAISLFLRGYVLFPGDGAALIDVAGDLATIAMILVSVIAALLTVRPLFRLFLRSRAYRVKKGPDWAHWRKEQGADRESGKEEDSSGR